MTSHDCVQDWRPKGAWGGLTVFNKPRAKLATANGCSKSKVDTLKEIAQSHVHFGRNSSCSNCSQDGECGPNGPSLGAPASLRTSILAFWSYMPTFGRQTVQIGSVKNRKRRGRTLNFLMKAGRIFFILGDGSVYRVKVHRKGFAILGPGSPFLIVDIRQCCQE